MNWAVHPLRPRDFPRPLGFALETSRGPREISWSLGMYNPIHPSSQQCTDTLHAQHFQFFKSCLLMRQNTNSSVSINTIRYFLLWTSVYEHYTISFSIRTLFIGQVTHLTSFHSNSASQMPFIFFSLRRSFTAIVA